MHLARRVAHEPLHLLQSAECGYIHTLMQNLGRDVAARGVEEEFTTSVFCQVHLLTAVLADCCADSCNAMIHGSQREKLARGHPRRLHTIIEEHNTDSHAHLGHLRQAFSLQSMLRVTAEQTENTF